MAWFRRRSRRSFGRRDSPVVGIIAPVTPAGGVLVAPVTPAGGVLISPITAGLLTLDPLVPMPRATPEAFCLPEVRYLALRYLEISGGRRAYTTTTGVGFDDREVLHYHFPDGYHTTSEDSAVDRLRFMLGHLVRERGYRCL